MSTNRDDSSAPRTWSSHTKEWKEGRRNSIHSDEPSGAGCEGWLVEGRGRGTRALTYMTGWYRALQCDAVADDAEELNAIGDRVVALAQSSDAPGPDAMRRQGYLGATTYRGRQE